MKKKLLAAIMAITMTSACTLGLTACGKTDSADKWGNIYTVEAAYAVAKDLGYDGTLEEFIESISGKNGKDGNDGKDGVGIKTAYINDDGELILVLTDDTTINCGKVSDAKKKDDTEEEIKFGLPLTAINLIRNVVRGYGEGFVDEAGRYTPHLALDIKANAGDKVLAVADGIVTQVVTDNIFNNNYVTITHGNGATTTSYMYTTAKAGLKIGDTVKRGDIIGSITENAFNESDIGCHLHFEMKIDGKYVDPAIYLFPEEV